jgi:hypothetical protein
MRIVIFCTFTCLFVSCSSFRQKPEPRDITRYTTLLHAIGEPVDIRSEICGEWDWYTRFLFLPSFFQPICITVRGGQSMPGNAMVRTRVIQVGRGIPLSLSWEPEYNRLLFSSDILVDSDKHLELLRRINDLKYGTNTQRPTAIGILDGESCVFEHAEGTNDYFFIEVHSPNYLVDDHMKKTYDKAFPDEPIDLDAVNDLLRRTANVVNWFAEQTKIDQLQEYKYKEDTLQQDESTVPSETAPNTSTNGR